MKTSYEAKFKAFANCFSIIKFCVYRLLQRLVCSASGIALLAWGKLDDYTGFAASLVKAFQVLIIAGIIFYPGWSFPLWLMFSHSLPVALQYVIYALLFLQFIAIMVGVAWFEWKQP